MRKLLTVAALILFTGCGHAPIKPESLVGKNIAAIRSEDAAVRITHIDERKAATPFQFMFGGGFSKEAELTPGEHTLAVQYHPRHANQASTEYVFKLTAEPGHFYRIKNQVIASQPQNLARIWIVDSNSMKDAGDIISAENEPVTEGAPPFTQSQFFTWSPPQHENWVVQYRNSGRLLLFKKGANKDETYVISIGVFALPTFQTEKEFVEHLKKVRQRPVAPDRFIDLEDMTESFKGRNDFCVRTHHVAIDKSPLTESPTNPFHAIAHSVKRAIHIQPMVLENYGYSCRIPNNRNLVINFEYSRRAYEGTKDDGMFDRSEKAFAQLKF